MDVDDIVDDDLLVVFMMFTIGCGGYDGLHGYGVLHVNVNDHDDDHYDV